MSSLTASLQGAHAVTREPNRWGYGYWLMTLRLVISTVCCTQEVMKPKALRVKCACSSQLTPAASDSLTDCRESPGKLTGVNWYSTTWNLKSSGLKSDSNLRTLESTSRYFLFFQLNCTNFISRDNMFSAFRYWWSQPITSYPDSQGVG